MDVVRWLYQTVYQYGGFYRVIDGVMTSYYGDRVFKHHSDTFVEIWDRNEEKILQSYTAKSPDDLFYFMVYEALRGLRVI